MDKHIKQIMEREIKGCFDFFWEEANTECVGFGLTKDISTSRISTIAGVGFAFATYVIGVERGFISFEEGYNRTKKTLDTLFKIQTHHGFFPHFVDPKTLENYKSEYSTIDTTILICGGIVAASYFKGDVEAMVNQLINNLDWNYFLEYRGGVPQINMAYDPKKWDETNHFCPATWDQYAEQLMMYLLIAGSDQISSSDALAIFNGFTRYTDKYNGLEVVHCYANALFTHQFSHAFFPFQDYLDANGFDWFKNSVNATRAQMAFATRQKKFKTYQKNAWGLTAFLSEKGYRVFGSPPYGLPNIPYHQKLDGSIAPYGAMCSINFCPKEVMNAIAYYDTIPGLKQKYGFTDCFNLDTNYVSKVYLAIDKGPTILMLDNYLTGTTWKYFTQSEIIKKAINKLKFVKKES